MKILYQFHLYSNKLKLKETDIAAYKYQKDNSAENKCKFVFFYFNLCYIAFTSNNIKQNNI